MIVLKRANELFCRKALIKKIKILNFNLIIDWIVVQKHWSKCRQSVAYFPYLSWVESLFRIPLLDILLLIFGIYQPSRAACVIASWGLILGWKFIGPWHASWVSLAFLEGVSLSVHVGHGRTIILILGNVFRTISFWKHTDSLTLGNSLPIKRHESRSVLFCPQVHEIMLQICSLVGIVLLVRNLVVLRPAASYGRVISTNAAHRSRSHRMRPFLGLAHLRVVTSQAGVSYTCCRCAHGTWACC